MLENKAMVYLAQGDLAARAAAIRGRAARSTTDRVASIFGNYWDLYWVLTPDQQELLLRPPPSAFDDRATWAIVLAQTYSLRGDRRPGADLRRLGPAGLRGRAPEHSGRPAASHVSSGLALAYLGRKAEAIARGRARRVALLPISSRRLQRAVHAAAARADLHPGRRAGEGAGPARAAAQDARTTSRPAWLRIDPDVRSAAEEPAIPEAGARARA